MAARSALTPLFAKFLRRLRSLRIAEAPARAPATPPRQATATPASAAAPEPDIDWPPLRLELAQRVWGEGFLGPGGPEAAVEVALPFGVSSSNSLLEIGAGLGGGTRALAGQLGAYTTAKEFDPTLVGIAQAESKRAGLAKKAAVELADPKKLGLRQKYFDLCIIRERIAPVDEKLAILAQAIPAMKAHAGIVLSDYVATGSGDTAALDRWLAQERHPASPARVKDYEAVLAKHRVQIRTIQDESEEHIRRIVRGWAGFVLAAEQSSIPRTLLHVLLSEVELWARRAAAIEAGALRHVRISGTIPGR